MPIVKNWAPAIAWMSLIFLFSTEIFSGSNTSSFFRPLLSWFLPSLTSEQIDLIHFLLRKFAHWIEYFILCQFLLRGFSAHFPLWKRSRRLFWGLLWAMLYAAGDEWHQSFVPSRSPSPFDVLINSCGAICGAWWFERSKKMGNNSP